MTREELEALGVSDDAAGQILEALRRSDEAAESAAAERDRLREELREDRLRESVREALLRQGAKPESVSLLALAADVRGAESADGLDEERLAAPLRAAWPALFRGELPPVSPPAGACLDAESVKGMSVEEINRNWASVREALGR